MRVIRKLLTTVQCVLIFSVFVNDWICVLVSCGDFVKNSCRFDMSGKRFVSGQKNSTWFRVWIPVLQVQSLSSLDVRLWRPFSMWRLCDPAYSNPCLRVVSTLRHWKSWQPQLHMIGSSIYPLIIFGKTRRTSSWKRENVQVGCWAKGMWRQRPHHSSHSHDSFMNSFVPKEHQTSEVDVFYLRRGLWAGFSFSFPVFILCLCWTDYEKFCGF